MSHNNESYLSESWTESGLSNSDIIENNTEISRSFNKLILDMLRYLNKNKIKLRTPTGYLRYAAIICVAGTCLITSGKQCGSVEIGNDWFQCFIRDRRKNFIVKIWIFILKFLKFELGWTYRVRYFLLTREYLQNLVEIKFVNQDLPFEDL